MGTHPIFESDFDCLTVLEGNFVMSEGVANKNSLRVTNMKERMVDYKGLIVSADLLLNSKDPYKAALAKITFYSAIYALLMWISPSFLTQACLQVALYLTVELAVSKLGHKIFTAGYTEENEASFHRFCAKIIKIKDIFRTNMDLIIKLKRTNPMKFYFIALPALLFAAYLGTVAYLSTYIWCALVGKTVLKIPLIREKLDELKAKILTKKLEEKTIESEPTKKID